MEYMKDAVPAAAAESSFAADTEAAAVPGEGCDAPLATGAGLLAVSSFTTCTRAHLH